GSMTRLYEVNVRLPKRVMQERVRSNTMHIVESNSDGYILADTSGAASSETMKMLISALGDRLFGIRDVTVSSRRFFVNDAERPMGGGDAGEDRVGKPR